MKILFSGSGTLGPVIPLLAISEIIQEAHPDARFVWVGTDDGVEAPFVQEQKMQYLTIEAGKFRRYVSIQTVFDAVRIPIAFFQSLSILRKERPDVCISAGGFVSVPLHYAAWILGIPTWVHQQDVLPGLANKLMARVASTVTTALKESLVHFPKDKSQHLGNPIRAEVTQGNAQRARERFDLMDELPMVLVMGGGTGSLRVNQLLIEALPHLGGRCQVVHITGKERPQEMVKKAAQQFVWYHPLPFAHHELPDLYAAADLVVSRGGFGSMTELAALKKPVIFIPKPGHQEENMRLVKAREAGVVLDEEFTIGRRLGEEILSLLKDKNATREMGERLGAAVTMATKENVLKVLDVILQ